MNKVILIGRLTKDVELKKANDISYVMNSVAVNRNFKNKNEEYDTDFINFVVYKEKAELLSKWFRKGDRIGLTGRWQTRTYKGQNGKVYVNELIVEEIEFLQEKREQTKEPEPNKENVIEFPADDLPF